MKTRRQGSGRSGFCVVAMMVLVLPTVACGRGTPEERAAGRYKYAAGRYDWMLGSMQKLHRDFSARMFDRWLNPKAGSRSRTKAALSGCVTLLPEGRWKIARSYEVGISQGFTYLSDVELLAACEHPNKGGPISRLLDPPILLGGGRRLTPREAEQASLRHFNRTLAEAMLALLEAPGRLVYLEERIRRLPRRGGIALLGREEQ